MENRKRTVTKKNITETTTKNAITTTQISEYASSGQIAKMVNLRIKTLSKKSLIALTITTLIVVFLLSLFSVNVNASSVEWENNTSYPGSYGLDCTYNNWAAQTFTIGSSSHNVSSVYLILEYVHGANGDPTGTFWVGIRATSGNLPIGSDLTNGSIPANTIVYNTLGVWYQINITTYLLSANTQYAIVARDPTDTCTVSAAYSDGNNPYSGGQASTSSDSGSTWTGHSNVDLIFQIWGDDIPHPTIGQFQAPSTAYANKLFYLNATVSSPNGNTSLVNATLQISGTVTLLWVNSTNTFSIYSDTNNYCVFDSGLREYVNSTSYHLAWKIRLNWTYPEGSVSILSGTQVFDNTTSNSNTQSNLFTFTRKLIVNTASVDDNRVNPSQSLTFTGQLFYYGTSTPPENTSGISARVELAGGLKGSTTTINSTGYFNVTFNAEASVGNYSYNVYSLTSETSVANQSVAVKVDRFKVVSIVCDDPENRTNINGDVIVSLVIQYENDQANVTTGSFYLNGSHLTFNTINWQVTYSNTSVVSNLYNNVTGSGDTYGLNMVNNNSHSITIIWDNIIVSGKGATSSRVNINSYQQYWFTLCSQYDGSAVQSGTVTLNASLSAAWISANSRWEYNTTKSTVQNQSLYVATVNWTAYGITSLSDQSSNSTTIIWDNLVQSSKGSSNSHTNINAYAQYYFTLRSEYDNSAVQSGSVTLNGSLSASWISTRSRWEYNTTKSSPQFQALYVASVNWDIYNITSLSDQSSNSTSITWDKLIITLNTDTVAPSNGGTAHMNATATYAFDGLNVTTLGVTIGRNGSAYSYSTSWTDAEAGGTIYNFTVLAANDTTYNLTAFSSNTLTISWGSTIVIEVSSIIQNTTRTGIGQEVQFNYQVIYGENLSDVTSGSLTINGTNYSISNGWCNWTATDSNIELVTYAASGSSYNGTVFSQIPANPEVVFDEVNIVFYFTSQSPQAGNSIVITWTLTRLYDNSTVTNYNMTINVNYAPVYMNITQAVSSITDSLSGSGSKTYSIGSFTDLSYNMTTFTNIPQTVTWTQTQQGGFTFITQTPAITYSVTVIVTKYLNPVAGVQVVISGQVVTTDISGYAYFNLTQGNYPVTISSQGMLLYSGSIEVTNSTLPSQTFAIDLTPQVVPEFSTALSPISIGIIVIVLIIIFALVASAINTKESPKESWRKLMK